MRRTFLLSVLLLTMLVGLAPHAGAITGNFEPDHTNTGVGLVVSYDDEGEFIGRCSGTLLTATVVLTAGHCTVDAASARVYFEQDAGANFDPDLGVDPVSGYPETGGVTATEVITMPGYDDFATFPNTRDLGVVILDEPMTDLPYAAVADTASLDRLAAGKAKRTVSFTVSGYGVNYINPAKIESYRERMKATATLVNFKSQPTGGYNLAHSGNAAQGKGGTCFGDSGGPVFLGTSDVIMAVTSFGMSAQTCSGPGFAYRVDQDEVIDWLTDLLPEGQTLRVVAP